ncbi:unnamed protein product [Cyclocybe aegerita]|uniref:Uncharacterized protein n=1 Tax=Cyclocybe aegerita TaxID=1973307 RepID=A0A8S0W6M8_CYCAE|nr:unnamed protein product [Cyclocybe aegerita]
MQGSHSDADHFSLAPPVSRDGFSYQDEKFYVTSDPHKHPRMDAAELYELLTRTTPRTSDTTKGTRKGMDSIGPKKDREPHFYTAQMAHYGLKVLKTRGAAKKKLLAVFEAAGGELEVPETILDLEEELMEEWRKAEEARQQEVDDEEETGQKRKGKGKGRGAGQVKKKKLGHSGAPVVAAASTANTKMSKAQIQDKIKLLPIDTSRRILSRVLNEFPASEQIISEEITSVTMPMQEWAGIYFVELSHDMELQFQNSYLDTVLETYPSSTSAHLWAWFDFGIASGVMRSVGRAPTMLNEPVHVEWRGYDGESRSLSNTTFGPRNRAILAFLGNGRVKAEMMRFDCEGKFSFSGKFDKDETKKNAAKQKATVKKWKKQWREINKENQKSSNSMMYGSKFERCDESAFESDTTDGHHRRKKEIDLEKFLEADDRDRGSDEGWSEEEDSDNSDDY